jgi:hypothetical protein
MDMKRRDQWRPVLEAEVKRWSDKSCEQLIAELSDEQVYEVECQGRTHQVEVDILENNETYLHIVVSVDDGSLPASLSPLSQSFVKQKWKSAVSRSE